MKIRKMPIRPGNDSADVKFVTDDGKLLGDGFIGSESNTIALVHCPKCSRENYAPCVLTGKCCWCQFDANDCPVEENNGDDN